VWLSPEQVRIIPITDEQAPAAQELFDKLHAAGIRAELDLDADRMNAKIRKAQLMKVPYMAVLGKREVAENSVALRKRDGSQVVLPVDEFVALVASKSKTRDAEL
jgi:threonyl-tRNA synthetase